MWKYYLVNTPYQICKPLWLSVILLLSLYVQPLQAKTDQNKHAVQSEEDIIAFEYYQRSAHLGNVGAQLKLAGLYSQGIGVESDTVMSLIYICLAEDHGNEKAKTRLESLTPEQLTDVRTVCRHSPILKQYGHDALVNSIYPKLLNTNFKLRPPKRLSSTDSVSGSMYGPRRSVLSSIIIDFDIGADGRVRDLEIEKNFSMDSIHIRNTIDEMSVMKYRPASTKSKKGNKKITVRSFGHRSVWAQRTITQRYIKDRVPRFYKKVKKLRIAAEENDPYAQYELAMLILVFPG